MTDQSIKLSIHTIVLITIRPRLTAMRRTERYGKDRGMEKTKTLTNTVCVHVKIGICAVKASSYFKLNSLPDPGDW